MQSGLNSRVLPPVKAHMLLTCDRVKHYEDCEAELKRLKGEMGGEPEQIGGGANILPGKWDNQMELIYPEEEEEEPVRNYPPLLLLPQNEDTTDEEGMSGGGPLDSAAQRKIELQQLKVQNNLLAKREEKDSEETPQIAQPADPEKVLPVLIPAEVSTSISEQDSVKPSIKEAAAIIPAEPVHTTLGEMEWFYIGDI